VARFAVSTRIAVPIEHAWRVLSDWEGSAAWMVDATTVAIVGTRREGEGTRVRAVTRIAGVRVVDEMTVTRWEPPNLIVVRHHRWPIRGIAWFELRRADGGVRFDWVEELDPPLGPLGEAGGIVLRRPIERVLAKSAAKLKQLLETGA
jgi:uncharacterized protein YndB with AHSA1/START domain